MAAFRLANPDETATAQSHNRSIRDSAKAWACNHCDEFADWKKTKMRALVLDHLEHTYVLFLFGTLKVIIQNLP